MLPDAKSHKLMYAADNYYGIVYVYRYPRTKSVGELTDARHPYGLCSDPDGNVFVTNGQVNSSGDVLEYTHGGTEPIATLQDGYADPAGCAIDPGTENLAVANVVAGFGQSGDVVVYQGAQGTPTAYSDPNMNQAVWCTYDSSGNLYVEGYTVTDYPVFAVLKKGSQRLKVLDIGGISHTIGGIAWDGKYLVVGGVTIGSNQSNIYQVRLSGLSGKIVNTITLDGFRIWLGGITIFAHDILKPIDETSIGRWEYPQGGPPIYRKRGHQKAGGFVPDQTISVPPRT